MLKKTALKALKKKLPKDGLQRVAEKSGVSKASVEKILNEPNRFNASVIAATLTVIEEYQQEIVSLENRAKTIIAK